MLIDLPFSCWAKHHNSFSWWVPIITWVYKFDQWFSNVFLAHLNKVFRKYEYDWEDFMFLLVPTSLSNHQRSLDVFNLYFWNEEMKMESLNKIQVKIAKNANELPSSSNSISDRIAASLSICYAVGFRR